MKLIRIVAIAILSLLFTGGWSQSVNYTIPKEWVATDGGGNAYTATITGFTLTKDITVKFKFATDNTGAATIAVNSGGVAKPVYKKLGTPVEAGDLTGFMFLSYDGTQWQLTNGNAGGGGGGTPGGSDTQVQYNNAGSFGGITGATTNGTVMTLTSPVLITPALGTPASGVATNLTGTAAGLTAGTVTTNANLTGDVTSVGNATTLATVNSNIGSFGSATQVGGFTVNAKGLITAASNTTITPGIGSITGLGTGVATALAVNTGSAGAFVVNGGALGTPSSGTLTSATGLPISTGVSGLGTGVATALGVNVGSAGAFVTFNGALGTPSSGTLTNATGLPVTGLTGSWTNLIATLTGTAPYWNVTGATAATTPTITASGDIVMSGSGGPTATLGASGLTMSGTFGISAGTAGDFTFQNAQASSIRFWDGTSPFLIFDTSNDRIHVLEPVYDGTDTGSAGEAYISQGTSNAATWGTLGVVGGGTGATTLTGLLQGNGTSAVTAITNSSTAGQTLRVTGASMYAWGALDLADTDAITGDLPYANIAQGSARSVLGVTGNSTADVASIQGTASQVLAVNSGGTALAFEDKEVLSASIEISSAEILAGNTTPKTIIAAPGAGKMIQVISINTKQVWNSVAYTANTTSKFKINGVNYSATLDLAFVADTWSSGTGILINSTTSPENQPLVWTVDTGDPLLGNSTIKVRVVYKIITF